MTDPKNTLRADVYWAAVPEWLLDADISDRAIRVYGWLARRAGQAGKAMPSRNWLATKCRCSTASIDRATNELIDIGAVTRERRYTENGDLDTTEYTIHIIPNTPPPTPTDSGPGLDDPSSPVTRGTRTGEGTGTRTGEGTVHAPVSAYREPPYREPNTDTSLRSVSADTGDDNTTSDDPPGWVRSARAFPILAAGIHPRGPGDGWEPTDQAHAWRSTNDGFPRKRDLLWEACDVEFGAAANDRERGRRSKAVKDLRDAGVDPVEVQTLAAIYRLQFSAACTDMAVAGRVGELRHLAANPDRLPGNKTNRAQAEDTITRAQRRAQLAAAETAARQIGTGQ